MSVFYNELALKRLEEGGSLEKTEAPSLRSSIRNNVLAPIKKASIDAMTNLGQELAGTSEVKGEKRPWEERTFVEKSEAVRKDIMTKPANLIREGAKKYNDIKVKNSLAFNPKYREETPGKGIGYKVPILEKYNDPKTSEKEKQEIRRQVVTDDIEWNPILKALNTEEAKAVTGFLAEHSSNLGLKSAAARKTVTSFGKKSYQENLDELLAKRNDPNNSMYKKVAYGLQDSGLQSGIGVLLNFVPVAGPTLSTAFFGAISAEGQRQEKGRVEGLAPIAIDIVGDKVLSGVADDVLKQGGKGVYNGVKNFTKGGITEGGTEVIQTIGKLSNDYANAVSDEDRQKVVGELVKYVKEGGMTEEFLVGGISGGAISSVAGAMGDSKLSPEQEAKVGILEQESITNSKKEYQNAQAEGLAEMQVDGKLNPKIVKGRVDDVSQKIDFKIEKGKGDVFRKFMEGKEFANYDEFAKTADTELRKALTKEEYTKVNPQLIPANTKEDVDKAINSLPEKAKEGALKAVDTKLSMDDIAYYNNEEATLLGIVLDAAKDQPGANLDVINSNIKALQDSGIEIPGIAPVETEVTATIEKPAEIKTIAEKLPAKPVVKETVVEEVAKTPEIKKTEVPKIETKEVKVAKAEKPTAVSSKINKVKQPKVSKGVSQVGSTIKVLKNQIGDIFDVVNPVGDLWESKGNVLYISPKRKNSGFMGWLRSKNFIESVAEAGNDIYKVKMKPTGQKLKSKTKYQKKETSAKYDNLKVEYKQLQKVYDNAPTAQAKKRYSKALAAIARQMSKYQEKGGKTKNLSDKEVREQVKRIPFFKNLTVKQVNRILTPKGKEAWGSYRDALIKFVNNPKETTLPHEAGHAFIDMVYTEEQKQALYDEVRKYKNDKTLSDFQAEEFAVELMAKRFVKKGKPQNKLARMIDWLVTKLKQLVNKADQIDILLSNITSEKGAKLVSAAERFKEFKKEAKFQEKIEPVRNIVTAKGRLSIKETFEDVWTRVYGFAPDATMANLMEKDSAKIAGLMAQKGFSKGKQVAWTKARGKMRAKLWQQKQKFKGKKKILLRKVENKELNRKNLRLAVKQLLSDLPLKVQRKILSQVRVFDIKNKKHLTNILNSIEVEKKKELIRKERADMQAKVIALIHSKNIKKTENLQKAWKFPTVRNMSMDQLTKFEEVMKKAEINDIFLTQRQLETVKNTELEGIKTLREGKIKLAEKLGVPVSDLNNISVGFSEGYKFDALLAEQHPFYKALVEDLYKEQLQAEERTLAAEKNINKLIRAARRSRKRSILDYLIPTDKFIFNYLESNNKEELAKLMTPEELKAAEYIAQEFEAMRDYLIANDMMGEYRKNYMVHIRRGFLETFKDDGFVKAWGGVFEQQKENEATFKIVSETDEILPLEKFFQFAMRREGGMDPSKNIARSFMLYKKTFETKRALDAIMPMFDVYVSALSPQETTEKGKMKDETLKKFYNEWMNNKKGRRTTVARIAQGSKVDILIRGVKTLTTLLDLGGAVPIGVASVAGEEVVTTIALGPVKMAKGSARMATKQGRKIIKDNRAFVGKEAMEDLTEASDDAVDKAQKGLFILFRVGNLLANKQFLLGSLTNQEFESGKVSPERIAEIKRQMGRWRVVEGSGSIMGSTSVGKLMTQYKTWAVPPLLTSVSNLKYVAKNIKRGSIKSSQAMELYRAAAITTTIAFLISAAMQSDDEDEKFQDKLDRATKVEKGDSFLIQVQKKAIRESLTMMQALDARMFLVQPRAVQFFDNLINGLVTTAKVEKYEQTKKGSYKKGDLKGPKILYRTLTPGLLRQINLKKEDKKVIIK